MAKHGMGSWKQPLGKDDSSRPVEQARELYRRGEALLSEELLDEAAGLFEQCVGLTPGFWEAWYDLGLIAKWQKRWDDSLRFNRRAFELQPDDEAVCWNMGIAATAVRDWEAARAAWRGAGIALPEGAGPISGRFGMAPVRLNPDSGAEVVWCDRVDPVRGIILSVPLPESGHRWGDCVLHDGEPKGERIADGRAYPVFDELERWEASAVPTLQVEVVARTPDDADALVDLFDERGLAAEDWTHSVRRLCRACSEGSAHTQHDPAPSAWVPERDFGLAASLAEAEELLARWADAGAGRRYGRPELVG